MTRGQQKQIETISKEEPSAPKKAKLAKAGTMAVTAKVCVYNRKLQHSVNIRIPSGSC